MSIIDSQARVLQEMGLHTQNHNVISREDSLKLFQSPFLWRDSPCGYQNFQIFTISILTAMRPSVLAFIRMSQFQKLNMGFNVVFTVSGVVGIQQGAS